MKTTSSQGGADTVPRRTAHRHPFPRSRWNDKPRPDTKLDTVPPCLFLALASSLLVSSTALLCRTPLLQRTVCAREQSDSGAAHSGVGSYVYAAFVERRHFKLVARMAAFFGVLLCHRGNECIGDVGTGNAERCSPRSDHCSFKER